MKNAIFLAVLIVVCLSWIGAQSDAWGARLLRCKYSVRDVAFVNVHGKSWQLQLVKPERVEPELFAQWNGQLKSSLEHSNVDYIWLGPNSDEVQRWRNDASATNGLPAMALVGDDGTMIPVSDSTDSPLEERLNKILNSPVRDKILDHVVDALCVFVLVESGDEPLDAQAKSMTSAAIEQITKQMWTLEKPADKGPALVTVSNAEKSNEKWLLQSLGISESSLPAVAIVYGQGRRLGEVLTGDDLNLKQLVGQASLCGQDCECDLNRDWLYGAQMIHVWNKQLERMAESSLSFDPQSAFVIAEVAQIMQKNSGRNLGQNSGRPQVNLGGGLIIHDLDPISKSNEPDQSVSRANTIEESDINHPSEIPSQTTEYVVHVKRGISIPWQLIVGLAAVTIFVFVLKLRR